MGCKKADLPWNFYPRPPRGGRLAHRQKFLTDEIFLSTPSARRATRRFACDHRSCQISIHALREEGDISASPCSIQAVHFYPRPPRGGRRQESVRLEISKRFLSTPSARRATERPAGPYPDACNFYPRPPRGGRHHHRDRQGDGQRFLSTPSARRATGIAKRGLLCIQFLSTPSARRATSGGAVRRR